MSAAKGDAGAGAGEDFAFHRAILAVTGNPCFTRVFGSRLIPQQRFRLERIPQAELTQQLHGLQLHEAMRAAVEAGDVQAARKAVHDHLMRSRVHFRGFLEPWMGDPGRSGEPLSAAGHRP